MKKEERERERGRERERERERERDLYASPIKEAIGESPSATKTT